MIQENVSLEEFEQEARSFLDAHASRRPESRTLVWGEGTDSVSLFDERTPELAIAVVPSARGKGVGSALIDALLERARGDGYPSISLSVDRNNAGAIELYARHGFERVGEQADSVTMLASLS